MNRISAENLKEITRKIPEGMPSDIPAGIPSENPWGIIREISRKSMRPLRKSLSGRISEGVRAGKSLDKLLDTSTE